jgi:hypothetical protein
MPSALLPATQSCGGSSRRRTPFPEQQPHQKHLPGQRQHLGQIDGDVACVADPAGRRDAAYLGDTVEQAEAPAGHLHRFQHPDAIAKAHSVAVDECCLLGRKQRQSVLLQLVERPQKPAAPDGVGLTVEAEAELGMVQHHDRLAVEAQFSADSEPVAFIMRCNSAGYTGVICVSTIGLKQLFSRLAA